MDAFLSITLVVWALSVMFYMITALTAAKRTNKVALLVMLSLAAVLMAGGLAHILLSDPFVQGTVDSWPVRD